MRQATSAREAEGHLGRDVPGYGLYTVAVASVASACMGLVLPPLYWTNVPGRDILKLQSASEVRSG